MEEIREVYKDILAEYPNCGGFERNADKFMAEVKRIDQTFSVVSKVPEKNNESIAGHGQINFNFIWPC